MRSESSAIQIYFIWGERRAPKRLTGSKMDFLQFADWIALHLIIPLTLCFQSDVLCFFSSIIFRAELKIFFTLLKGFKPLISQALAFNRSNSYAVQYLYEKTVTIQWHPQIPSNWLGKLIKRIALSPVKWAFPSFMRNKNSQYPPIMSVGVLLFWWIDNFWFLDSFPQRPRFEFELVFFLSLTKCSYMIFYFLTSLVNKYRTHAW